MPIFLKYVSVLSTEIRRRGLSQKAATAASTTGLTSPVAVNVNPLSSDSSGISSKPTSGDSVVPGEGETSFSDFRQKSKQELEYVLILKKLNYRAV